MREEIDPVEEASEESFPASDAPAWAMGEEKRIAVTQNAASQRFEASIHGHTAFLEYWLARPSLTLVHTEVPAELRGQGVGGVLVNAALAFARREELRVIVRCSFAREYLRRHPQQGLDIITA